MPTTTPPDEQESAARILAELRAMRDEIRTVHQEVMAALTGIREVFNELHRVEAAENAIESGLDAVAQQLGGALEAQQPSLDNCAACGSAVERHQAENGILLICKACGRASFVDRRTRPDRRNSAITPEEGIPSPTIDTSDGWTGK